MHSFKLMTSNWHCVALGLLTGLLMIILLAPQAWCQSEKDGAKVDDVLKGLLNYQVFDVDFDKLLVNKDYNEIMKLATEYKEEVEGYNALVLDTTAKRLQAKSKLVASMTALGAKLEVPIHVVDSKIVLLKSNLKALMAYYNQLKGLKQEFDNTTKDRFKAMLAVLARKFAGEKNSQVKGQLIQNAIKSSSLFKSLVADYYQQSQVFQRKAAIVVMYIRKLDQALTKLKDQRFALEMRIISNKMDSELERIVKEVGTFSVGKEVEQIDNTWEQKARETPDVQISDDAILLFMKEIGVPGISS